MINRLILWLSLLGMVLAVHLWIQKSRGFDQGCLGLDTHPAIPMVADEGCREVGLLPASHILGVSNAAWGYAFYFGLALVSVAKLFAQPACARRWHLLGEIATAAALLYSLYLVYEMGFVAHAWCILCAMSAAMVAALFALHLLLRIRGGFQPPPESARLSELGLGAGALFAGMGLLVAVLLFVDRLGTRPLDQGSTGREMERIVGETLPVYIDGSKLLEMRACHFDWGAPALDLAKFIGPETPFLGKADGVPVIVFFDPNCPHCRDYYPVFLRVVAKYRDRMRFTLLPRLLWDESIPQAEALRVAESSGKYFELWKAMFDKQPGPGKGMTVAEIAELFRRLGIDDNGLDQRLAAARPAVIGLRDRAREAGVDAVPAVYIGGRRVWGPNRGEDCLGTLIERMLSGTVKPVEDAAPQ